MRETMEQIANQVRGVAAKHRVSQADLAGMTGLSRNAINMRMNGKTAFSATDLLAISRELNEPIAAFFPAVEAVA